MVLDGPINDLAFQAYVEQVLVPELRPGVRHAHAQPLAARGAAVRARPRRHGQPRLPQGRRSARGHRGSRRDAETLLYLPPYSPDFNPIENAFAKLKALLRKAAERTVEGLWTKIGELLNAFTPQECANYFAVAGYDTA